MKPGPTSQCGPAGFIITDANVHGIGSVKIREKLAAEYPRICEYFLRYLRYAKLHRIVIVQRAALVRFQQHKAGDGQRRDGTDISSSHHGLLFFTSSSSSF